MISARIWAFSAGGALASATLLAVTAAPASAASGGTFETIYSLTSGACIAVVDSSVHGPGYPDSAAFTVSTNMTGIGSCSLKVTLHWKNLTTSETGIRVVHAIGPGAWMSDPKSSIFQPGHGQFVATVTVDAVHLGESGQVEFSV